MIGRMRGLLRALGWGAVLAAAAGVAAHYSGLVSNLVSRVAAFTPVLIIVGVLGLLLLLAARRAAQDAAGWKPAQPRARKVTTALKAYALLATSADKGAVRDKALLDG